MVEGAAVRVSAGRPDALQSPDPIGRASHGAGRDREGAGSAHPLPAVAVPGQWRAPATVTRETGGDELLVREGPSMAIRLPVSVPRPEGAGASTAPGRSVLRDI